MKHWTRLLMRTRLSLEKENMIWNMTGSFFYAFASMVLSFLVLRIAGNLLDNIKPGGKVRSD